MTLVYVVLVAIYTASLFKMSLNTFRKLNYKPDFFIRSPLYVPISLVPVDFFSILFLEKCASVVLN